MAKFLFNHSKIRKQLKKNMKNVKFQNPSDACECKHIYSIVESRESTCLFIVSACAEAGI